MNEAISLSGAWDFRLDEEANWRPIRVPGCWEQIGVRKDHAGPAWYRRLVMVPPEWAGRRIWLRFGGVSYHCAVFANGQPAGEHAGLWDAFAVEITSAVAPGEPAELLVRVEKPAGLTAGPDSPALPGSFPLRETLSGFLPYVWGQIFGGIWQEVELVATGQVVFEDVLARGDADGRVLVEVALSAPAPVTLEVRDPHGNLILATGNTEESTPACSVPSVISVAHSYVRFELEISEPRPWSPASPALYEARLRVADGDERVARFGLRSLRAEGATIALNGRPIYPRMALSWGWYPQALHSNPGPARVRADFERLRRLGYNGVKLCLWFPPQYYFDLADELGMLLWVELPMWIPRPTPRFRAQLPVEYERLMRQSRGHPSVILYTLGCELSSVVDAGMLGPLFDMVKRHAGDALVRDNSGSGEAYGGLLNEHAEFYDYHFYAAPEHFRALLDSFSPRWRPVQPWLFGEFCESDTFRDLRRLDHRPPATDQPPDDESSFVVRPWWALDDPELNPQGARWLYELPRQEARLRASGLWERGAELERISERQALWHRKHILELTRLYREVAGYVVTGEADTPIGTAGMWDDTGRLKFDPGEFRAFNADLVALVGWDRRRAWVAGGDRAAPWDAWCYPSGAAIRPHLVASHYGAAAGPAHVAWSLGFPGAPPLASGERVTPFALAPGDLRELAVAELVAPAVDSPRQALLSVTVSVGGERASNAWPLWFFPRDAWRAAEGIALLDPAGRLRELEQIAPQIDQRPTTNDQVSPWPSAIGRRPPVVVIATAWAPKVASFVSGGGRAVVLLAGGERDTPLPLAELPFWREAVRMAEPHPAWGDFPLDDALAGQLFGCAADHAIDLAGYSEEWWPILRRLDARTMRLHEYAAEVGWGQGRMIVSTLRFEGGQGSQPLGIARNTAAAHLLWCWARYLQTEP